MKAIKVTFDEELLERLDRFSTAEEQSRSAVLREAVADYLACKEAEEIARRYQAGYRAAPPAEFEGWADEGVFLP